MNHLTRPYFARLRQAPEVASTPQRIEKDLQQARQLAALLEDEHASLMRRKEGAPEPNMEDNKSHAKGGEQGDVVMADGKDEARNGDTTDGPIKLEAEPEPLEKGSEAVERRIEKLVTELQVQHDVIGDGVDSSLEAKKVRCDMHGAICLYGAFILLSIPSPSLLWICIWRTCVARLTLVTIVLQSVIMWRSCIGSVHSISGSHYRTRLLRLLMMRLEKRRRKRKVGRKSRKIKKRIRKIRVIDVGKEMVRDNGFVSLL